ncbi:MAG: hypothetical protein WCV50_03995 [Patescibacteria group bacterium]|jgi:hypothetical protein
MHSSILYAVVIVSVIFITGDFIRLSKLPINKRTVWLMYFRTLILFLYTSLVIINWDLKIVSERTVSWTNIAVTAVWLVSWLFERKHLLKNIGVNDKL